MGLGDLLEQRLVNVDRHTNGMHGYSLFVCIDHRKLSSDALFESAE
jgi:hypothetical protein